MNTRGLSLSPRTTNVPVTTQQPQYQYVKNCLVRVVTRSPRFTLSMPRLMYLHRVPVRYVIISKMCSITYQALSCKQRSYLHSLFTPYLFSFDHLVLINFFVPKINTDIGTREFALWNMFPSSVKLVENISKFRRHLKTYVYNFPYPL